MNKNFLISQRILSVRYYMTICKLIDGDNELLFTQ